MKPAAIAVLALVVISAAALATASPDQTQPAAPAAGAAEPEHIQIQDILIAFTGTPASKKPRTQEEAKKLAYEILERARMGETFMDLVKDYSDGARPGKWLVTGYPGSEPGVLGQIVDFDPGIYFLANHEVQRTERAELPRRSLVVALGDLAFGLKVGKIGIVDYDPQKSPFGYHIVKRLK